MSQSGLIKENNAIGATTYTTMAGNAAPVAGVLDIVGTGGITTSGAGGTVSINGTVILQYIKSIITSAQLKNISINPIAIIPAPPSNSIINILALSARFKYGGTSAFTLGDAVYANPFSIGSNEVMSQLSMQGVTDVFTVIPPGDFPGEADVAPGVLDAQPLLITCSTDFAGNAAGDNELIVECIYWISNLN